MATVKELQEKLEAKQDQLQTIFEESKTDDGLNMTSEILDDVRARNEELSDIGKELEKAREIDTAYKANQDAIRNRQQPVKHMPLGGITGSGRAPIDQLQKSLGEMFTEAEQYKNWQEGQNAHVDLKEFNPIGMEQKTTMTTAAGFAPETIRTGRVVDSAQRRPMIDSLIPQTPTAQSAIKYMEETTFTNAAAMTAEGATLPESALAYTERSAPLEKNGTWLPATDEQIEDEAQVQALINNRLTLMLALTRETQLLSGNGSTPQLTGFYNKAGIQTQAKGSDSVPDAFFKAITKVRSTGFADPTGAIMHPNDWQTIRLLKTTDGIYIWGSPSEAGEARIWGLPVIATTAATENTGLVGDFQLYSELFRKMGVTIERTNSHSDNFVKDIQAIKIRERIALVIYRATAFCTVTGI